MRRLLINFAGVVGMAVAFAGSAASQSAGSSASAGWTIPALPAPAPIAQGEFQARRAALAAAMQDGALIVFGAEEPAADYLPFAQNVNFRYLTGIAEPGAVLIIEKSRGEVNEQLFVLPRDPSREVWEGVRLGAEGGGRLTGIRTRDTGALSAALDSIAARAPRLYTVETVGGGSGTLDVLDREQQIFARLKARNPRLEITSIAAPLQRLRAAKSASELDRIRRAVYITLLAQRAAIQTVEPGMNEFEIHGLIEYTFRRNGAERPAFASIVGSGPNSTTLHYRAADRFMTAADMVVMDIGASYDGYAADVTRTVPVSGTFSPEQRAVYQIVLDAQKAAEQRARVGGTWGELNEAANRILGEGLTRLGLIESPTATYDCGGRSCLQYRLFYMHGLGHGIGLEVHDPGGFDSASGQIPLGSVFTIEPGIYVRADALDHLPDNATNRAMIERLRPAVQRYQNIGVRIEDDYIITAAGPERISAGAPREIAEIEAMMRLPAVSAAERRGEVVEWYRAIPPR